MRVPNPTIRAMMVVIAVLAVCVTVLRDEARPRSHFILNGSLPMVCGLLLGTLLTIGSNRGRRFFTGFQVFGWVAIVGLSACYVQFPGFARWYFTQGYLHPAQLIGVSRRWPPSDALSFMGAGFHWADFRMPLLYFLHTMAVSGPELVIGLLGGLLFSSSHCRTRSSMTWGQKQW